MSDYIFSSVQQVKGEISKHIEHIYESYPPKVTEYHGGWGTLAVSKGHYNGFQPFENDQHILVVIGGPVFYFRDNDFLTKIDSNEASKEIYQRWVIDNKMHWDEDLSGPFTILLVDKKQASLKVVTDLMSFIPAYACEKNNQLYLSTHVDALAKSCEELQNTDPVSLADFVLNDVITYPYTAYTNIKQLAPGSISEFRNSKKQCEKDYWLPLENNHFPSLNDAAIELRDGIQNYVDRITINMNQVAQFISAGEDSRSLSDLLPQRLKRDGYVFLDSMNREGNIAKKVANTYGVNFTAGYRSNTHYLDILSEASSLVGSGSQFHHAHSLGFDKKFKLDQYPAVFGGFLSDTLLKGHHVTLKYSAKNRYPFLPQVESSVDDFPQKTIANFIEPKILNSLKLRKSEFNLKIKEIRPTTNKEWGKLYPISMHNDIPNLYSTRRLFKSYEPFMCKEAVKISASVPTSWKLNRRLFHKAMMPYLSKSKWLLHADGRLPYFSWWLNSPLQFFIWLYRHLARRLGLIKGNQGPWGDWGQLFESARWTEIENDYTKQGDKLNIFKCNLPDIIKNNQVPTHQRINLMQLMNNFY